MTSFIVPLPVGRALAAVAGGKVAKVALAGAGMLGNAAAAFLTVAPVFSFMVPIIREKAVGDRTAYGHIATLFSSVAMFLYALPDYPKAIVSLVINGVSTLLQLTYVGLFLWFAIGPARRHAFYAIVPVLVASTLMTSLVVTKVIWDSPFVAYVAAGAALASYCFVAVDVVEAAKSKEVGNMDPLHKVLLGLVNASASTGFGFFFTPRDLYTAIPNAVGVVILLAQLVVFIIHYKPEPEQEPLAQLVVFIIHYKPEPEQEPEPEYGSDLETLFV